MLKMPLFVVSALAAAVALTGCSKTEEQPAEGQIAAAEVEPKASVESDVVALPPPPKDSDVVVSVGETQLTWGELSAKVDEMVGLYAKMTGGAIPTAQLPQAKQEFRRQQVQMFIVDNVIAAAAKELGVAVDEAFRAKQIAELEKRQGQSFDEILKSFPLGEAEAKSMQIRGDALKANPGLVQLEAVSKWDGRAPGTLVIGDKATPMLNLDSKAK